MYWYCTRRICDFPAFVCASPSFVKKYGKTSNPEDLIRMPSINYKNSSSPYSLIFKNKKTKEDITINTNPILTTNTLALMLKSTIEGIGYCRLPEVFCKDKIKTGELLTLLPNFKLFPERSVYAVYPDRRYLPIKVKLFIDAIKRYLS